MNTHADKTQENKSQSISSGETQVKQSSESTFQFVDKRPGAIAQRMLQKMADTSLKTKEAIQLQAIANNHFAQRQYPIQNNAGLEKKADLMGKQALNQKAIKSRHPDEKAIRKTGLLKQGLNSTPQVIQPKLFFKGKWYGSGDQGVLSKLTLDDGSHLPGWNPNQIENENQFYILNEHSTEWIKDQRIYFNRIPKNEDHNKASVRTGVHGPEIKHSDDDPNRVTPKQTTLKTVSKAILIKDTGGANENNWHWTLECEVDGGKMEKSISMDLEMNEHRVYYGPSAKVSKKKGEPQYNQKEYEAIPFTLKHPLPVQVVYGAMFEVVKEDGGWTDTAGYNCQNFVLSMLKKLDVIETDDLKEQAEWREEQRQAFNKIL